MTDPDATDLERQPALCSWCEQHHTTNLTLVCDTCTALVAQSAFLLVPVVCNVDGTPHEGLTRSSNAVHMGNDLGEVFT